MKIGSKELGVIMPYLTKVPVLTITLMAMAVITIAIEAIVELNTTSVTLLICLITLVISALVFAGWVIKERF